MNKPRPTTIPKLITYQGVTASMSAHARRLGLQPWHCHNRVEKMGGYDPAQLDRIFAPLHFPNKFTYEGVTATMSQHARRHGLNPQTCWERSRKYGFTPDKYDLIFKPKYKGVVYRGILDSWCGHARRYGIDHRTLMSRLRSWGRKPENLPRVFGHDPAYFPKTYLYDGIRATLKEHAERLGITWYAVKSRMKHFKPSERTLPILLRPQFHPVRVTYQGVTDTIDGHCKRLGINKDLVYGRIASWGLSEDVLPKVFATARLVTRHARLITCGDITDTIAGWARRLEVSETSLVRRIAFLGVKEALSIHGQVMKKKRPTGVTLLEFRGEKKTMPEWAREYGLLPCTLRARLATGLSLEEALTRKQNFRRTELPKATQQHSRNRLAALHLVV